MKPFYYTPLIASLAIHAMAADLECESRAVADAGMTCWQFISKYNIPASEFYAINPAIGGEAGCAKNFQAGVSYCAKVKANPDKPPTFYSMPRDPVTSTTAPAPTPTPSSTTTSAPPPPPATTPPPPPPKEPECPKDGSDCARGFIQEYNLEGLKNPVNHGTDAKGADWCKSFLAKQPHTYTPAWKIGDMLCDDAKQSAYCSCRTAGTQFAPATKAA